jgi:hypothetical protein
MNVRPYTDTDETCWDELVISAPTGTFLHSRRFLSYHKNRFQDVSLVVFEKSSRDISGALPAAVDPDNPRSVVSHPGATYGGLLYTEKVRAEKIADMLAVIVDYYKTKGFLSFIYKSPPSHLHGKQSQADLYALWKCGANIHRRALWNVISLQTKRTLSKGRKWGINNAKKNKVTVLENNDDAAYRKFHQILTLCLDERYGSQPIHTPDEMLDLKERFSNNLSLWIACDTRGQYLGGAWIFQFDTQAWHTQYIASTEQGRSLFAVDILLETIIQEAEKRAIKYFSCGGSMRKNGEGLNSGLFDFKAGFGYGSIVQDHYFLDLAKIPNINNQQRLPKQ